MALQLGHKTLQSGGLCPGTECRMLHSSHGSSAAHPLSKTPPRGKWSGAQHTQYQSWKAATSLDACSCCAPADQLPTQMLQTKHLPTEIICKDPATFMREMHLHLLVVLVGATNVQASPVIKQLRVAHECSTELVPFKYYRGGCTAVCTKIPPRSSHKLISLPSDFLLSRC